MKNIIIFVLFFYMIGSQGVAGDNELTKFETDYCTLFVEGTWNKPGLWKSCCYEHDLRYWFGGKKSEQFRSDLDLKKCVRSKAGSLWANIIYYGVRTGHYSPVKNKYKWGWGWNSPRSFQALSADDKLYILNKVNEIEMDEVLREKFIQKYLTD